MTSKFYSKKNRVDIQGNGKKKRRSGLRRAQMRAYLEK